MCPRNLAPLGDYKPDQEETTPPTSPSPTRPASSYRESEDFQILLKLQSSDRFPAWPG
jgi:hypothetical protein